MTERIEFLIQSLDIETGPPATELEVREFEMHLGLEFPAPYKEFLKALGNITLGDGVLGTARHDWLAQPSVVEQTDELRLAYPETFQTSLVAIHPDGGGNYWCVACEEPYLGKVIFWQHDVSPDQSYPNDPPGHPAFWVDGEDFWGWLSEILGKEFSEMSAEETTNAT
jgi:hypothetical protein